MSARSVWCKAVVDSFNEDGTVPGADKVNLSNENVKSLFRYTGGKRRNKHSPPDTESWSAKAFQDLLLAVSSNYIAESVTESPQGTLTRAKRLHEQKSTVGDRDNELFWALPSRGATNDSDALQGGPTDSNSSSKRQKTTRTMSTRNSPLAGLLFLPLPLFHPCLTHPFLQIGHLPDPPRPNGKPCRLYEHRRRN